ncbi:MAG: hypothetical protein WCV81_03540 [Microgenomates group bacterium]|jgi:hypothetical protein
MPDTFVQDILDPEEIEKRDSWNKRLDLPILVSLDKYFQKEDIVDTLLSGEFVQKINPDNYRIKEDSIEPPLIRYLGEIDSQTLPKLLENLHDTGKIEASSHFSPAVCILVDGTGHRNDTPESVLPVDQFVVNRKKYDNSEDFASNIKMLMEIVMGNKGIGKRTKDQDFGFSKDHPFYIFVSAFADEDLRQYMDEVLKIVSETKNDLVKVVGFLAPKVG